MLSSERRSTCLPNRCSRERNLDARADVYAIGAIAYHMLCGRASVYGRPAATHHAEDDECAAAFEQFALGHLAGSRARSDARVWKEIRKQRSPSVAGWLEEFETAVAEEADEDESGDSRVVILAPTGAEVYVDDERHGSIGRSGRVILNSIPPGRHVLRVARSGEMDDERVIEIRPGSGEQVIQAQLRQTPSPSQFTPSRGGPASGIGSGPHSSIPGVVMCAQCGARFAAGAKFCGRCGSTVMHPVNDAQGGGHSPGASPASGVRPYPGGQSLGGDQSAGGRSMSGYPNPAPAPGTSGHNFPAPARINCPHCGLSLPLGTKFCGRCGSTIASGSAPHPGAPQPVQIICRQCSTSYPPGTKFCGRCGTGI